MRWIEPDRPHGRYAGGGGAKHVAEVGVLATAWIASAALGSLAGGVDVAMHARRAPPTTSAIVRLAHSYGTEACALHEDDIGPGAEPACRRTGADDECARRQEHAERALFRGSTDRTHAEAARAERIENGRLPRQLRKRDGFASWR